MAASPSLRCTRSRTGCSSGSDSTATKENTAARPLSESSSSWYGSPSSSSSELASSCPNSGTPKTCRRLPLTRYRLNPSVLTRSASSTPSSWLLVPE